MGIDHQIEGNINFRILVGFFYHPYQHMPNDQNDIEMNWQTGIVLINTT